MKFNSDIFGRAHPRAGGENLEQSTGAIEAVGSSPRGRGKRIADLVEVIAERLIPARAGKTGERAQQLDAARAHPRAGGENPARRHGRSNDGGSSPRGRGKLFASDVCPLTPGLIPARAGKT